MGGGDRVFVGGTGVSDGGIAVFVGGIVVSVVDIVSVLGVELPHPVMKLKSSNKLPIFQKYLIGLC